MTERKPSDVPVHTWVDRPADPDAVVARWREGRHEGAAAGQGRAEALPVPAPAWRRRRWPWWQRRRRG